MASAPLAIGAVAAALAAAAGLIGRDRRLSSVALAFSLVLALVLVTADSWDDPRLVDLRESSVAVAGSLVAGLAAIAAGAALFRRVPAAFPLLAAAALPFRVPIDLGANGANLLLPLYLVIAAATVAAVWEALSSTTGDAAREEPVLPEGFPGAAARLLPALLAGVVALYAVQTTYSDDFSQGLQNLCFFYLPFSALFALLLRVGWSTRLLAAVFGVVLLEAAVFVAVAFVEYAVEEILWNEEVMAANLFHPYFRVNSLFWDPNILSRYLAVGATALAAVLLATRSRRVALAATAGAVALMAGMVLTFSQTGFIALLGGLVVLAALRWSARWMLAIGGVGALAAVALVLAGGASLDFSLEKRNLDAETSGRAELISGGVELAGRSPVVGLGSGSFSKRFERRFGSRDAAATASHTEPVTIAAEQGLIGVALYLALLVIAVAALLAGLGSLAPGLLGFRAAPSRGPPTDPPALAALTAARFAALACFVVMLVHSLSYAAFLTDPITWALLAVGLALVRDPLSGDV